MARHSAAKRSHPTSEVRGRSWEDPMPKGQQPIGVTPRPRSGAAAKSARLQQRRNGREELPCIRGQGRWPRGATPRLKAGAGVESARLQWRRNGREELHKSEDGVAAQRSYPIPEARGGGWEDQPHIQGAVAAWAQEGLEELSYIEGQEGRQ